MNYFSLSNGIISWFDSHSGTIKALSGVAKALFAWATWKNRQSLNELILGNELSQRSLTELVEQNSLYKVELQFLRKRNYKSANPFLMGIVLDPIKSSSRTVRVKKVGANAINFKRTNLNSTTYDVIVGHNVLTANTEQDVDIRFVPSDDFEDIIFDFVCSDTYIT